MPAAPIQPTHKPIRDYYAALREYSGQHVTHEGAVETAFSRLLADTARPHGWLLIPKLSMRVGGKTIAPDGTLRDEFNLKHGYWEAKDTHDDLDEEITKKIKKGYPLSNTIFEDTREAVLCRACIISNSWPTRPCCSRTTSRPCTTCTPNTHAKPTEG